MEGTIPKNEKRLENLIANFHQKSKEIDENFEMAYMERVGVPTRTIFNSIFGALAGYVVYQDEVSLVAGALVSGAATIYADLKKLQFNPSIPIFETLAFGIAGHMTESLFGGDGSTLALIGLGVGIYDQASIPLKEVQVQNLENSYRQQRTKLLTENLRNL